ncbi:MAG: hypothetical protein HOV71_18885 [Hamadaea sp.]|nr:hypothetical protein [Hamadaea sp.]NUR50196.1 hypothetical protein [Hamadaea sp.]NUT04901.1 hypothetical protein [Hamadaea sp.]
MRTVKVDTPSGQTWGVRVVWQPRWSALVRRFGAWRRKRKGEASSGNDLSGCGDLAGCGSGDGDLAAIVLGIVLFILGVLVFWFILLPLLLLIVDILVVVLLLLIAIPARVLFRRPWTVEAAYDDGQTEQIFSTDVVGWRRALETRDDIAAKLRQGYPAPIVGTLRTRLSGPPAQS